MSMYFEKVNVNILVKEFSKTLNFTSFDVLRDKEKALKKLK